MTMSMDDEFVICPRCGTKQGDCWEWVREQEAEKECPGCGAELVVWAEHSVTYFADLKEAPTPSAPTQAPDK